MYSVAISLQNLFHTLIFAVTTTLLNTSIALAQSEGTITASPRAPVSIAIRQDVAPYVSDEGTAGLELDIVKAVFNETNYRPVYTQLPRVRMIQTFSAGALDGVLTSNITVDGEGCLTNWYIEHQNVGLTLASKGVPFHSLQDVANHSVITFDGATRYLGAKFAAEAKRSPRYVESSDQNVHVSLVYFGNFDVAIGDEWILRLAQVKQKEEDGTYLPLTIHRILPTTLYGARFHDVAICDAFNNGLEIIRQNGTYDRIVRDHIDQISAKINLYDSEYAQAREENEGQ